MIQNEFVPTLHGTRRYLPDIILRNRTPKFATLPNSELLGTHALFARALAWVEVAKYMRNGWPNSRGRSDSLENS